VSSTAFCTPPSSYHHDDENSYANPKRKSSSELGLTSSAGAAASPLDVFKEFRNGFEGGLRKACQAW